MIRLTLLIALSFYLFSTPGTADEVTDMSPGTKVSNMVTMGNVQIPLPKGEWELKIVFAKTRGGAGKAGRVLLVQDQKQSGFSEIDIIANVDSCTYGRRPRNLCDHEYSHHNESDRNYNKRDGNCWDVTHLVFNPNRKRTKGFFKDYWNQRNSFMKTKGQRTTTYIGNAFFRTNQCKYAYLRYLIRPDHFGFSLERKRWRDNAWHRDQVDQDRRKKDFVSAVKAVGEKLQTVVDKGFDRELDGWDSDIVLKFE